MVSDRGIANGTVAGSEGSFPGRSTRVLRVAACVVAAVSAIGAPGAAGAYRPGSPSQRRTAPAVTRLVDVLATRHSVRIDPFIRPWPKLVGAGATSTAQLGSSVALSADGTTALVGGPGDNGGAGAVWVFTRTNGVWSQQARLAAHGSSVALSGDGNTALIGDPGDNDHAGAASVFTRTDGVWSLSAKLVGSGETATTEQGASVALSGDGNTALIGGPDDNNGAGAAWVFTRVSGGWGQQGPKLIGSGAIGDAHQGSSVALSGDGTTALIGGPDDNGSQFNGGVGAAWTFTRAGGVWSQQGSKLTGSDAIGDAQQGSSVALSSDGSTALIGGPDDNDGAGATWVFTRTGFVWTEEGSKLVGGNAGGEAKQGSSVALSGDGSTALIGGPSGRGAWVFTRAAAGWGQQGSKLVGSGAIGDARQGFSVALSGDASTALVGGPDDNLGPYTNPDFVFMGAGATWVFTNTGGTWSGQAKLVASGTVGSSAQGTGVGLSGDGNTALIGGPNDSDMVGAAWVFARTGGVWGQQGSKLIGSQPLWDGSSGFSVALSGNGSTVLVGRPFDQGDTGGAWVFTRANGLWRQQAKLVGSGAIGNAHQAWSVALSGDGNTALIGGPEDKLLRSDATAGAAWVFTRVNGVWHQQAKLVGSGAVDGAAQGWSVALSGDGRTALIGGPNDNGAVGAAWVFTRGNGVWHQQAKLVGPGAIGDADQGGSVALSGDGSVALIGGPHDNPGVFDGVGAAWVFTRSNGVWQHQAKLVGSGAVGQAAQGTSVALSRDGSAALVGGPLDNANTGAAWMFTLSNDGWSQRGPKLVAPGAIGEALEGSSVALSGDGSNALIGGPGDDNGQGAAWVFAGGRPVARPSNKFTVSRIRTFADGTIGLRVKVPGPGNVDVLETAWKDNLASTAVLLQPASRRFVFARAQRSAGRGGIVNVTVIPNARGRLLVGHHTYRITLRLWVSYTPTAGRPRSIGFYGLHFPAGCADTDGDVDCDRSSASSGR